MIFYTYSVQHLLASMALEKGKRSIKKFADGELYVKLDEQVNNKNVWVVGSTVTPAENLLELLFLLDALHRNGAQTKLLMPYCSYARQDRATNGEALSFEVIANCFKQFTFETLIIVHIHNPELKKFLSFEQYIPLPFFAERARMVDCIVAPDKGAHDLACAVAQTVGKPMVFMEKVRPEQEKAEIVKITGEIVGKKALLVDDMIATGTTLIKAAEALKKQGVEHVYAAATHGLFVADALKHIQASPLEKIYVSNTIAQKHVSEKIDVIDISDLLYEILRS